MFNTVNGGIVGDIHGYKFFHYYSDGGQPCLAWDTPGLTKIFEGQETWTHNFCRNPGTYIFKKAKSFYIH